MLRKTCSKFYYRTWLTREYDLLHEKRQEAENKIKMYPNDKNICLEAVKINGFLLEYVHPSVDSDSLKEICLEAVKKDGESILYMKKFKNQFHIDFLKEICLESVKNDVRAIENIITCELLDGPSLKEICLETVKINRYAFDSISRYDNFLESDKNFLKKICLEAIKKEDDKYWIKHVLKFCFEGLLDRDSRKELYLEAVKRNEKVIEYIEEFDSEILDEEICSEALKNLALRWVTRYQKYINKKNTPSEAV